MVPSQSDDRGLAPSVEPTEGAAAPAIGNPVQDQGFDGNGAFAEWLALSGKGSAAGGGAADPAPAGPVRLQVAAFIPAEIGRAFGDWEHPTDLANQDSFDAEVDGQPGTWFEEPMSVGNPFSGASQWYVGTDNRGFGGNTAHARIYTEGFIDPSTLRMCAPSDTPVERGSGAPGIKFASQTAGSERIRTNVDGLVERNGSVESQSAAADVSHGECWSFPSPSSAVCDLHVQGSYPFAPQFAAPDIDYALAIRFVRSETGTTMSVEGSHNGFPAYEVLVNGTPIWQYMPSADGPGLWNLGFQYVQIAPYAATL